MHENVLFQRLQKGKRTHLWEQLLLSVVAGFFVLFFFLFLEQFGIVSRLLQTLIVTMLCKQKVL